MLENLSKQQTLDVDPKTIRKISFTGNLDWDENTKMFFITEEVKKKHFRFFTGNYESIINLFCFNIILI